MKEQVWRHQPENQPENHTNALPPEGTIDTVTEKLRALTIHLKEIKWEPKDRIDPERRSEISNDITQIMKANEKTIKEIFLDLIEKHKATMDDYMQQQGVKFREAYDLHTTFITVLEDICSPMWLDQKSKRS